MVGRCFHFLLFFLLSISTRENKIKIPQFLSQESLWNGRKRMKGVGGFLHIKPYSISFSLPSHYQAASNSKSTDPKPKKPQGTYSAFPKRTPRERNDLLRAPAGPSNTFPLPPKTARLGQKWEISNTFPEFAPHTRIRGEKSPWERVKQH